MSGKLRNQMGNLRYFAKSRKITDPDTHEGLYAAAQWIGEILEELTALEGESPNTIRMP